jgi:urease accessory protein UreF
VSLASVKRLETQPGALAARRTIVELRNALEKLASNSLRRTVEDLESACAKCGASLASGRHQSSIFRNSPSLQE